MPRRYSREKRQAAVDETRARIVEATVELHHANGILATRFEDIARRADVATATVYRHFPTLEQLVGACGELTMRTIRPPTPEAAAGLFVGAKSLPARVERLVREMTTFYVRSWRTWVVVLRDRHQLPGLQHFVDSHRAAVEAYVREALRPAAEQLDPHALQVVCTLVDYPTWQSLADRNLSSEQVADELCHLVLSRVKRHGAKVS